MSKKGKGKRSKSTAVAKVDDRMIAAMAEEETAIQPVDPRTPLFKLNIGQPNPASAVIDVTWCLNRKAYDQLAEKGVRFPFMLITVFSWEDRRYHEGEKFLRDYTRAACRLDDAMVQLRFNKPGTFKIVGSVVWAPKFIEEKGLRSASQWVKGRFLKKEEDNPSHFAFSMTDYDNQFRINSVLEDRMLDWDFQVDIAVQEGFFAKEPPSWLKWYGNLWCEGKPVDQCHFRRRVLWSIPKFPFVVLYVLWVLALRLITVLFALLIGRRDVKLSAMLHPFDLDVSAVFGHNHRFDSASGYWWLSNSKGQRRHWVASLSMAPFGWVVAIFAFFGIFFAAVSAVTSFWDLLVGDHLVETLIWLGKVLGAYAVLLAVGVCVGFFIELLYKLGKKFFAGNEEEREARREAREAADAARLEAKQKSEAKEAAEALERYYSARLEPLVCDLGGPKAGSLKALPKSHQTFRLRFLDFKAQVCKPFRTE